MPGTRRGALLEACNAASLRSFRLDADPAQEVDEPWVGMQRINSPAGPLPLSAQAVPPLRFLGHPDGPRPSVMLRPRSHSSVRRRVRAAARR
jgi:hypothetical protein